MEKGQTSTVEATHALTSASTGQTALSSELTLALDAKMTLTSYSGALENSSGLANPLRHGDPPQVAAALSTHGVVVMARI